MLWDATSWPVDKKLLSIAVEHCGGPLHFHLRRFSECYAITSTDLAYTIGILSHAAHSHA